MLVVLGLTVAFLALACQSDTHVGRRLRDAERRACARLTCGYLGGLGCCRRHFEPKAEEKLRDLRDCDCLDRLCPCCTPAEAPSAAVKPSA